MYIIHVHAPYITNAILLYTYTLIGCAKGNFLLKLSTNTEYAQKYGHNYNFLGMYIYTTLYNMYNNILLLCIHTIHICILYIYIHTYCTYIHIVHIYI